MNFFLKTLKNLCYVTINRIPKRLYKDTPKINTTISIKRKKNINTSSNFN